MARVWTLTTCYWNRLLTRYVADESTSVFTDFYRGPVELCKESDAEKAQRQQLEAAQTQAAQSYYNTLPWQQNMAQQQMDLYNKQMQSQIGFQNQYLTQEQQQYQDYMKYLNQAQTQQQNYLAPVSAAMTPYLTGDIGYSDAQMKALNNQGMSQIAGGYSDASSQLAAMMLAHGDTSGQPLSGTGVTNMAELQAGLANQTSSMRNTNLLSSYNQALANKFNAASAMTGAAGQMGANIGTYAGGANSSLAGYGTMARNYATAPVAQMPGAPSMLAPKAPPGIWSGLASSFGSTLGSGLGSMFLGGAGNMVGALPGIGKYV